MAGRIGRQPHEILLKRQGEIPFKNHLTLENYGVSNVGDGSLAASERTTSLSRSQSAVTIRGTMRARDD